MEDKNDDTKTCSLKSVALRWVKEITPSVQEMALFSCGSILVVMQDNFFLRSGKYLNCISQSLCGELKLKNFISVNFMFGCSSSILQIRSYKLGGGSLSALWVGSASL